MNAKAVTTQQIQRLDRIAIEKKGMPSLALMENAGRCVAEEVDKMMRRDPRGLACVLCGVGNNAGDGFVAARHLWNRGRKVKVYCVGSPENLKADAKTNYWVLRNCGYPIDVLKLAGSGFKQVLSKSTVIVDALFGVGLNRTIGEPFYGIIEAVNASGRPVVAVDIPSGLDGTSGDIYGICVKASKTVTLSFPKQGFKRGKGPRVTGRVKVVDIGIPKSLQEKFC